MAEKINSNFGSIYQNVYYCIFCDQENGEKVLEIDRIFVDKFKS